MRSDQTAHFVATRPYASAQDRRRAVYAHCRRVERAQRAGQTDGLATEPLLAVSGETIMLSHGFRYDCAGCNRYRGPLWAANSDTHDIVNRSGNPIETALCAHCWGILLADGSGREPREVTR